MTASVAAAVPVERLGAVTGLFREIGDLKRVRTPDITGSWAQAAFTRAWTALVAGEEPGYVADLECAAALAGARLAAVDAPMLLQCGLSAEQVETVLRRAVDEVDAGLHSVTVARVRVALVQTAVTPVEPAPLPAFVSRLASQPRAGATAPGRPRIVVEPPENHAEHCWAVAVYGALLAEDVGADRGEVFLLGLAHHLHNAVLPDAGFAGDTLIGEYLGPLVRRLTEEQLAELPEALAARTSAVLAHRDGADTPTGRAFHAADVLDRVLQVHHHARAAAFTAEQALVDLQLVHASPVSAYHEAVLDAAGLAP